MADVRVVVGVDFSAISPAVVRLGLGLARRLGGVCLAAHAVEALRGDEERGYLLPSLHRWINEVRAEARTSLDELLQSVAGAAVAQGELRGELLTGPASVSLIRSARGAGARCLVLGGAPPARFLGATADRVVLKSPLPTLVVRRPPEAGYQRVLVGVDFSPGAAEALRAALELAQPDATVILCAVRHTWGLAVPDPGAAELAELRARLASWAASQAPSRATELLACSGLPKTRILEYARELGADLLAVGSRGESRVSHVLLGSIAEDAVRRAECDVLVAGDRREDFCLP